MEINKWYKYKDFLICYQGNDKAYGFNNNRWCDLKYWATLHGMRNNWQPASNKEVEQRLLEYAKDHYPVGTRFKSAWLGTEGISNGEFKYYFGGDNKYAILSLNKTHICEKDVYYNGEWAEIISTPKEKIDSWCVQVTPENRDVVKEWVVKNVDEPKYKTTEWENGLYAGIYNKNRTFSSCEFKKGKIGCLRKDLIWYEYFDKLLTTEEFYEKIGYKNIKVGDWVYDTSETDYYVVGKCTKIDEDGVWCDKWYSLDGKKSMNDCAQEIKYLRKALPHEIPDEFGLLEKAKCMAENYTIGCDPFDEKALENKNESINLNLNRKIKNKHKFQESKQLKSEKL